MMKKLFTILLSAVVFCQLYSKQLQIIATCDIHGNLSNFAKMLPVIRQYPDAIKLDLGDLFHGEPLTDILKGAPMADALNLAEYDFFIPGNHEFELPVPQLAVFLNRVNAQLLGQWQIKGVKSAPWKLVRRNGFTLAVIGMTANSIYYHRKLYPDLTSVDELDAIAQAMQEIRKHKIDAVVLARHSGNYLTNTTMGKFLQKFPEIRLVICSHTHKEIAGQRSGRTLIVQPGAYCASAALVTMRYVNGKDLLLTSKLLRPGKIPAPEIVSLQQNLQDKHGDFLQEKRLELTSFETQADQWLKEFCAVAEADCAILDISPMQPGNYTRSALLKHFPYRNRLLKISLTREEYTALLKEKVPARRRRFSSPLPQDKEKFTVVMDTHQFSRSLLLQDRTDFQLLPVIARDIILKEKL